MKKLDFIKELTKKYNVEIDVVSHKEVKERFGVQIFYSLLLLGGCYLSFVHKGALNDLPKEIKEKLTKEELVKIKKREGSQVIQILDLVIKDLEEEELESIILHEIGHLVNGHLLEIHNNKEKGIINKIRYELEADQFASDIVGKNTMLRTIIKMLSIIEKNIPSELMGLIDKENLEERIKNLSS